MTWTDFFSALLIAVLAGMQILQNYDAGRKDHSIRQLENKLAKLESSATKEDHGIRELKNKLAKLESSTTKEEHSIRELENKLSKLESSTTKEEHSIRELENKLAKLESSATKEDHGIRELKNKLAKLESSATKEDHSIRELENKLAKLESSATKEENSIKQLENKLAKLESSTIKRLVSLEQLAKSPIKDGSTEVVFLIDSSSSISGKDFKDSLAFVRSIPNLFGKNWDKYTYSILLFNETVHSHFIGQFENEQTLDNVVSRITRVYGDTDIAHALRYVQSQSHDFSVFEPNKRKILFIITDGGDTYSNNDIRKIEIEAYELKYDYGVYIFTIGVRNQWYKSFIENISSTPKIYFHHFLDNIDMHKIKGAVKIVLDADKT